MRPCTNTFFAASDRFDFSTLETSSQPRGLAPTRWSLASWVAVSSSLSGRIFRYAITSGAKPCAAACARKASIAVCTLKWNMRSASAVPMSWHTAPWKLALPAATICQPSGST